MNFLEEIIKLLLFIENIRLAFRTPSCDRKGFYCGYDSLMSKTVTKDFKQFLDSRGTLRSGRIAHIGTMDTNTTLANTGHILLVEDDAELASLVQEFLVKNGFSVDIASDGVKAVSQIIENQPDLVILDIMLPGKSGMDICREVRPHYHAPILMLTALDEDIDQMLGLELGADDYVIKPIKPRLLLSRIKALLRRADHSSLHGQATHANASSAAASLRIDTKARTVSIGEQSITLTTAEFDLLSLLADNAGDIVSRDLIISHLRGFAYDGLDRSIDRRVSRLRKKLSDDPIDPKIIKTVRGKGYLLGIPVEN